MLAKAKLSRAIFRSEWTWIALFFLIFAAQVVHRIPASQRSAFFFDFTNVYSASRVWLHGHNPYQLQEVYHAWATSNHGSQLGTPDPNGPSMWAAVHPPSTLLLLSPLAALNAVTAHLIWISLGIVLLIVTFFALFSLGGIDDIAGRMLLVVCALASAPVQVAIECGQPALPSAAMVILAVWAFSKERLILAGVLLGLATALKVQVGAPFILYYLFIRQWRVGTLALVLFAVATMVAIGRMHAFGIDSWWADWHRNIAATLEPNQVNDPRPGGPWRNDMVNLQVLLDVVLHRDYETDFCILAIFMPLLAGFLMRVRPGRAAGKDLLALSMVALLTMLPLYHRLYDSVLLLMLLTWALSMRQTRQSTLAIAILAMLAEFLVPIDLVPSLVRRTHAFDSLVRSMWWQGVVVPHHAWAMLVLTLGTFWVFCRRTATASAASLRQPIGAARHARVAASPHSV